uniref:unspecific monooxygenase n=1 Tax=Lates calcarifer TaxID=8187 RepID=A0A4W6CPC9_LATCA
MGFLPLFSLETWILLITFVCIFVMYGYWTFGVFEKLGIPGPKPLMYWGTITRHNQVFLINLNFKINFRNKTVRIHTMIYGNNDQYIISVPRTPMLAVMDPDMLKTILVKECLTYFTNRRNLHLNGDLYDTMFLAEDDQWRRIRNILSPSFTSGRIKEMFSIMKHHSRKMTDRLKSQVDNDEVMNVKEFFGLYGIDVMTSCMFGVDMDLINNPSSPLITYALKVFKISIPFFLFQGSFPIFLPLLELLGFSLFPKSSTAFFKMVVEKIRAERNGSSGQKPGDLLQHMINSQTVNEAKNEKQKNGLTDHEIVSQVTVFMFGGFETSASTLAFLAYNLARNPEVMARLQKEIDSTFPNKGPVQYEALMQMEYLDSVVNESLRLYPPNPRFERIAKETVTINRITIPKGMIVMIPVYALHHDPELWPEPEEFKPDRFSKENKQSINSYTYLPFGFGPRNCLGKRFALVMVKLALVEVLQNYSFSVCKETEIPLQMSPEGLVGPLRPIKLKLVTRSIASENVNECI